MDSNQADYIFLQAQDMFPQLEASVIYMVLSECDFKINEALASLTTLTQTVDDANNLTQDLHHLESQPNLDQFYGNNSLLTAEVDLDKDHDLVIGKDKTGEISSFEDKVGATEHIQDNFSGIVSVKSAEFSACEKDNCGTENGFGDHINDTLKLSSLDVLVPEKVAFSCDNLKEETHVLLNTSLQEIGLNQSSLISSTLLQSDRSKHDNVVIHQKKIIRLMSYILVGGPNGKRLLYSGSNREKRISLHATDVAAKVAISTTNFPIKNTERPVDGKNKTSDQLNSSSNRIMSSATKTSSLLVNRSQSLLSVPPTNCDKDMSAISERNTISGSNGKVLTSTPSLQFKSKTKKSNNDTNGRNWSRNESPDSINVLNSSTNGSSGIKEECPVTNFNKADFPSFNPPFPQRVCSLENSFMIADCKYVGPYNPYLHLSYNNYAESLNSVNSSAAFPPLNGAPLPAWSANVDNYNQNNFSFSAASRSQVNSSLSCSFKPKDCSNINSEKQELNKDSVQLLLPCMYILRGASGSGKSTLAEKLSDGKGAILSTDDYFVTPKGYVFNPSQLSDAHDWNKKRAEECLVKGISPVIIDNTNTTSWEMHPYMAMAARYGYKIEIREPDTWWKFKASELAKRNKHGVPKETIARMLERYEKKVTIRSVLGEELYQRYREKCLRCFPSTNIDSRNNQAISELGKKCSQLYEAERKCPTPMEVATQSTNVKNKVNINDQRSSNENSESLVKALDHKETVNCLSKNVSSTKKMCETELSRTDHQLKEAENTDQNISISKNLPTGGSNSDAVEAVSTPKKSLTKRSNGKGGKAVTKSLAASFQGDILRKKIKGCGNNLKNSTNLIESPASGKLIKTPVKTVFKSCDAETNTEDVFFIVLAKLDQGEEVFVEEQILSSDRNRFQCAAAFQRKKMLKLMYDKSTSTEDLVEHDEDDDLKTLQLLFPDFSIKDLTHMYIQCDKQLGWATNVIAESTLFDSSESLRPGDSSKQSPSSSNACKNNLLAAKPEPSRSKLQNEEKGSSTAAAGSAQAVLCLRLHSEFLRQLVALLGTNENVNEDCVIDVDYDLAFNLYDSWKNTSVGSKNKFKSGFGFSQSKSSSSTGTPSLKDVIIAEDIFEDQLKKDEELARRIQKEEQMLRTGGVRTPPTSRKGNRSNRSLFSPNDSDSSSLGSGKWSVERPLRPLALTEIMSEESAAEHSAKRQYKHFKDKKLSTQLKREELHAMYTSIPPNLLDDIFAANNYNLEDTMFDVNCVFCEDDDLCFKTATTTVSKSLETYFAKTRKNRPLNQNRLAPSLRDENEPNRIVTYDDVHHDVHMTYDEIRTEATLQRNQMHECQRKAAIANRQKKGELAYYYAQQAYQHQKKLREANQRAAAIIYQRMNEGRSPNELDLHGLHVDEAIDTLRSVLVKVQQDPVAARYLNVITGRGLNSSKGIPKLKNAVLEWLKNKNIQYDLLNDGCVKIVW